SRSITEADRSCRDSSGSMANGERPAFFSVLGLLTRPSRLSDPPRKAGRPIWYRRDGGGAELWGKNEGCGSIRASGETGGERSGGPGDAVADGEPLRLGWGEFDQNHFTSARITLMQPGVK